MAKLMARKGQGEGEGGGSSSSLLMKRSKSGDIPRPDSLSLVRSVSGELRSEQTVLWWIGIVLTPIRIRHQAY
jgi:hypothetical protein